MPDQSRFAISHLFARLMLRAAISLMLLVLNGPAKATCILAILNGDEVILAADGLNIHPGGRPTTICKLIALPGCYLTMSGVVSNNETGFDLVATARAAFKGRGKFRSEVDAFDRSALAALQGEIGWERANVNSFYQSRKDKPLAVMLFAAFERGHPVVILTQYSTVGDEVKRTRKENVAADRSGRVLVFCRRATEVLRANPELTELNPVELAERLLNIDLHARSLADPSSGPPVSILRISKAGPQWIEGGACTCSRN